MSNNCPKNLHTQYLKAMGIQVWVRRHIPPPLPEESSQTSESIATHPQPAQIISVKPSPNATETAIQLSVTDYAPSPAVSQVSSPTNLEPPLLDDTQILAESSPAPKLDWHTLQNQVATCTACELAKTRTNTVFGVGNQQADLMLIGEGPGADEDAQGEPFVGKAGRLLNDMLYAIGLKREDVYIANVIKCRPPNNRNPNTHELTCCTTFLQQQITQINPKLIVAVGRVSAQYLLATQITIGKLRGQRFEYGDNKIPLIATYHPAYLLRRPSEKRQSWRDLQFIIKTMTEL